MLNKMFICYCRGAKLLIRGTNENLDSHSCNSISFRSALHFFFLISGKFSMTVVSTTNGKRCAFPFVYKRKRYNSCTTVGTNGKPWCSTTKKYRGKWGYCKRKLYTSYIFINSSGCLTVQNRPNFDILG